MKVIHNFVDFIRCLTLKHLVVHLPSATAALRFLIVVLVVDLDLVLIFNVDTAVLIGRDRVR